MQSALFLPCNSLVVCESRDESGVGKGGKDTHARGVGHHRHRFGRRTSLPEAEMVVSPPTYPHTHPPLMVLHTLGNNYLRYQKLGIKGGGGLAYAHSKGTSPRPGI